MLEVTTSPPPLKGGRILHLRLHHHHSRGGRILRWRLHHHHSRGQDTTSETSPPPLEGGQDTTSETSPPPPEGGQDIPTPPPPQRVHVHVYIRVHVCVCKCIPVCMFQVVIAYLSTVPNLAGQYRFLLLCPTVPPSTSLVLNSFVVVRLFAI